MESDDVAEDKEDDKKETKNKKSPKVKKEKKSPKQSKKQKDSNDKSLFNVNIRILYTGTTLSQIFKNHLNCIKV